MDDLSGGAVDLSAMPAAHALNLPRSGVVGASLNVTADTLSLHLNYEQQPLELLGAGSSGTTAVAMTAVMAAIAIPAYPTMAASWFISAPLHRITPTRRLPAKP